jgi:hypothetical protein
LDTVDIWLKKVLLISGRPGDEDHKCESKISKIPLKKKRFVELNVFEEAVQQSSFSIKKISFDEIDMLLREGVSFGLDMDFELSLLQQVIGKIPSDCVDDKFFFEKVKDNSLEWQKKVDNFISTAFQDAIILIHSEYRRRSNENYNFDFSVDRVPFNCGSNLTLILSSVEVAIATFLIEYAELGVEINSGETLRLYQVLVSWLIDSRTVLNDDSIDDHHSSGMLWGEADSNHLQSIIVEMEDFLASLKSSGTKYKDEVSFANTSLSDEIFHKLEDYLVQVNTKYSRILGGLGCLSSFIGKSHNTNEISQNIKSKVNQNSKSTRGTSGINKKKRMNSEILNCDDLYVNNSIDVQEEIKWGGKLNNKRKSDDQLLSSEIMLKSRFSLEHLHLKYISLDSIILPKEIFFLISIILRMLSLFQLRLFEVTQWDSTAKHILRSCVSMESGFYYQVNVFSLI